ncbi:MAG: hypothetical protein WAU01_08935, partial [Saprospiraceae bacterium]
MKTRISFLCCVFCLYLTPNFGQNPEQVRYNEYAYMKVAPEKQEDYIKLEKAWKKLHMAKKKAGKLDAWSLTEVISPSGADVKYNYVTRNSYLGETQFASSYDEAYMPENWQSLLTIDEIDLVLRTDEIRTLVKNEIWVVNDQVWAEDYKETTKIFVYNYFSIPKGKTNEDHDKVEKEIWKPIHNARIKAGTMKGWVLQNMMLPFGASLPYSSLTLDGYTSMKQYLIQL